MFPFPAPLLTASQGTIGAGDAAVAFSGDGANWPFHGPATGPAALYVSATQTTWIAREAFLAGIRLHRMATYDHSGHSFGPDRTCGSSGLTDDSHGVPALFRDASGFIHWFGGDHASPLRHMVTAAADNNDTWIDKGNVNSNSYAYPHPIFDGSNLFLFVRKRVATSPANQDTSVLLKSTAISSGAITFASEVTLVDFGSDSRFYLGNAFDDGTYIHLFASRADGGDTFRRDIYHFKYEKSTGHLVNSDGSHSDSTLPVGLTGANSNYRIFTQSTNLTNVPAACVDGSGNLHVVFIDGSSTSFDLKHMKFSGGSWSAAVTVESLTDSHRYNDIALVANGSTVELYYTTNPGATFTRGGSLMRRRDYSGGSWSSAVTVSIAANGFAYDEPSTVKNGPSELRLIFTEIHQDELNSDAGGLSSFTYGANTLASRTITAPDSQVGLQLKFEGADAATSTFDESIYQPFNPVTFAGNAQIDTADFKFGASSLLLDGSGDYLTLNRTSNFSVSAAVDYTFEAWIKVSAFDTSDNQTIFDTRGATTNASRGFSFFIDNTTKKLSVVAWDGSGAIVINISSTNVISAGSWTHVALTRSGSTWRLFIGGNLEASGTQSGSPADAPSEFFNIGRSGVTATPRYFHGWIDMVRVKRGHAEWTASFTPSSSAYARP